MIEEEDLVAILKDVAAGGSSGAEDFNLSTNGPGQGGGGQVVANSGGVPVSLAGSQMADLINTTLSPATSNSSNPIQQLQAPLQTQMASASRPQMQQTLPNISQPAQISSGCETGSWHLFLTTH